MLDTSSQRSAPGAYTSMFERAGRCVTQVRRAQVEDPVGQPEVGYGPLGPVEDLGVDVAGLLGRAEPVQLHLVELVDP